MSHTCFHSDTPGTPALVVQVYPDSTAILQLNSEVLPEAMVSTLLRAMADAFDGNESSATVLFIG